MQGDLKTLTLKSAISLSVLCAASITATAATVTLTPIDDVTISTQLKGNGQNGNPDDRRFMGVSDHGDVLAVNQDTRNVFVWNNETTYNLGSKDCDSGSTLEPTHLMNISRDGSSAFWRCTDNGQARRMVKSGSEYAVVPGLGFSGYYPNDIDTHIVSKDGNAVKLAKNYRNNQIAVGVLNGNGSWTATPLTAPELGNGEVVAFSPNGRYVGVMSGTYYVVDLTDQTIVDEYTDPYIYYKKIMISNSGNIIVSQTGKYFQDVSGDASSRLHLSGYYLTDSTIWTSWSETDRYIDDFVVQNNGNLQGWTDLQAVSISQNGLYIAGVGTNAAGEENKGFLLEIDPTAECVYGY